MSAFFVCFAFIFFGYFNLLLTNNQILYRNVITRFMLSFRVKPKMHFGLLLFPYLFSRTVFVHMLALLLFFFLFILFLLISHGDVYVCIMYVNYVNVITNIKAKDDGLIQKSNLGSIALKYICFVDSVHI